MIFLALASAATPATSPGGNTGLVIFVILVLGVAWIGLRNLTRSLRAGKTKAVVGAGFVDYAREALVNAAKIDGRVSDDERAAVSRALGELAGAAHDDAELAQAFAAARLNKDELVAYLATQARAFSREQKMALLKALMTVFAADGSFDETEHAALVDYTAAVGFDRQSAPQMLRSLASDFRRGNIT